MNLTAKTNKISNPLEFGRILTSRLVAPDRRVSNFIDAPFFNQKIKGRIRYIRSTHCIFASHRKTRTNQNNQNYSNRYLEQIRQLSKCDIPSDTSIRFRLWGIDGGINVNPRFAESAGNDNLEARASGTPNTKSWKQISDIRHQLEFGKSTTRCILCGGGRSTSRSPRGNMLVREICGNPYHQKLSSALLKATLSATHERRISENREAHILQSDQKEYSANTTHSYSGRAKNRIKPLSSSVRGNAEKYSFILLNAIRPRVSGAQNAEAGSEAIGGAMKKFCAHCDCMTEGTENGKRCADCWTPFKCWACEQDHTKEHPLTAYSYKHNGLNFHKNLYDLCTDDIYARTPAGVPYEGAYINGSLVHKELIAAIHTQVCGENDWALDHEDGEEVRA